MVRNVDSPSKFLMYPRFIQVVLNHQVDDMTIHNTRYTFLALIQKVFANTRRVGKGFSGVKTLLYASMLVPSQQQAEADVEDRNSQRLEILQLKQKLKRLERKKKLKSFRLNRLRRVGAAQRVESFSNTVLDEEFDKEVVIDDESQGRLNQEVVNAVSKGVSAVSAPELGSATELTVFDDEDVTMTMAQTLIKLKAEKARIIDEKIAQKLHDEEEPKKKRVADETLLQESFKKLRAAEVSGFESTQEIPIDDPKEITKNDVQNMLEIVPYALSNHELSDNSAANTLDNKDTPLSCSIIVEEVEAPQVVTLINEPVVNKPTIPVSTENANESVQEDVAAFEKNDFYNPFHSPVLEESSHL
uniref:Uncharacterized protein n=1 Tax=Tanacetum cinerariifolium TaxID=118510 RepID=A0A6L2MU06_TANCI|nr:hypothetical protein [Tanacetum cinerariifolium]